MYVQVSHGMHKSNFEGLDEFRDYSDQSCTISQSLHGFGCLPPVTRCPPAMPSEVRMYMGECAGMLEWQVRTCGSMSSQLINYPTGRVSCPGDTCGGRAWSGGVFRYVRMCVSG